MITSRQLDNQQSSSNAFRVFVRNKCAAALNGFSTVLRVKYVSNRGADASIMLIGKDSIRNTDIEMT